MRIVFISNYYPPFEVGGYEQLCRDVATGMQARGHEIAVLTSDHGIHGREVSDDDYVFRELRIGPDQGYLAREAVDFFRDRRSKELRNVACVERLVDLFRPDVVFIWNLRGLPMEIAAVCEGREDMSVAYWLAGYSPVEPDAYWSYWDYVPDGRLLRALKAPVRGLARQIMTMEGKPVKLKMENTAVVSHYMRETGIAAGTLPTNAEVIYNGVEFDRFYRPVGNREGRRLRLLQAGRVSSDKGVHTSIQALAHLARHSRADRIELLIAGKGSAAYERKLRQLVVEAKLEKSVKFQGWIARDRIPELMAGADVLLLPTEHPEPFARVMLEGMAAGLAVIGSRSGGTGELLQDGVNGLLFGVGDSAGLAQKIDVLLKDELLRQRLAAEGQKQVRERYTLDMMVTNLEQFLLASLAKRE